MTEIYKSPQESIITLTELMLPSHSNFSGKIHGGYVLSLMDKTAFASASKFSGLYCVTASVNRVDFLNPAEVGELLSMKAMVNYVGNSSMVIGIRVEATNVQTGITRHCNSSYFTMVAKKENGDPAQVPGLILTTKDDVRRFLRALKQQQNRNMGMEEFTVDNFNPENHKGVLDGCRVDLRY